MHILALVVGALGAVAIWWFRFKVIREATGEIADVAGQVRGTLRRRKLRHQAALSPLTSIDDPVFAAATVMAALLSDEVALSPEREAAMRREIGEIAEPGRGEEPVVYGKWAAGQIDDAGLVADKLAPFLCETLNKTERGELIAMIRRAARAQGARLPKLDARVNRLKQKLGFEAT